MASTNAAIRAALTVGAIVAALACDHVALFISTAPSGISGNVCITGVWVGSAADSTGAVMGAGPTGSSANAVTWRVTQTGDAFTGTIEFAGYPARTPMTVSGTIARTTATFTMSMPRGAIAPVTCSAVAHGVFEMDDRLTRMRGTYSGSNSCLGAFDRGNVSLVRR